MILSNNINKQSDIIGAFASGICLLHCIATPFIFVSIAGIDHHEHHHAETPFWWSTIDIIFIIISFFAVKLSAKLSSKRWIKYALFSCWVFLSFVLLNEKLAILHLAEEIIYIPSIALIVLHIYNRKYCQCLDEDCCVNNTKT